MDKRNKLWRCQQMARVFKARMILYAAYGHCLSSTYKCNFLGADNKQ